MISATGKPAAPFVGAEGILMSARAHDKDAAFAVMDVLTGDAAAIDAREARAPGRAEPARVSTIRSVAADTDARDVRAQLEHRCRCRTTPAMRMVWTPYRTALGEVFAGRAEPGPRLLASSARSRANPKGALRRVDRDSGRCAVASSATSRSPARVAIVDRELAFVAVRNTRARRAPDRSRDRSRARARRGSRAARRPCTARSSARRRHRRAHRYLRHREIARGAAGATLELAAAARRRSCSTTPRQRVRSRAPPVAELMPDGSGRAVAGPRATARTSVASRDHRRRRARALPAPRHDRRARPRRRARRGRRARRRSRGARSARSPASRALAIPTHAVARVDRDRRDRASSRVAVALASAPGSPIGSPRASRGTAPRSASSRPPRSRCSCSSPRRS